ncbi:VOC family protein [Aquincola sp. S2]|uniref:VOC family protein n=1 Tax=Pseudaquabacterium terrae TaxID=2732868 RepID=A0ABX2EEM2_9BURK|nr:VOC family protein [Aquabacterium terrae]NRF67066.1 VOC family protein [Aquabacterium terrae]
MDTTPYLPGKFVWFEHVSNDLAKARAFYEPLFGWHTEAMPMEGRSYQMLMNGNGGIGGLREADAGVPNHWISYLSVEDVDARFKAATAAGAKALQPPTDFPPVGRGAGLTDPTGAAFCLWRSNGGDMPDHKETPAGNFVWNELWTPDDQKALSFYETCFGYTHDAMEMGPDGTYYILKSVDGTARAGLAKMPAGTPPMWLPYVRVADCDATLAKAQGLGAQKVLIPPHDIPDVGRIAALIDPLGAPIAMITPAPM